MEPVTRKWMRDPVRPEVSGSRAAGTTRAEVPAGADHSSPVDGSRHESVAAGPLEPPGPAPTVEQVPDRNDAGIGRGTGMRAARRTRDVILATIDCTPAPEVIVVEAPELSLAEGVRDVVLGPLRSLREQFKAITEIGLQAGTPRGAARRRPRSLHAREVALVPGYIAAGSPEGRRILFVHGTPGHAGEWSGFLSDVPHGQYRIAVDRPGFGASGAEAPVVSLEAQARAVHAVLEATGSGTAILVGSSYGGPVALRVAAQYPDVVSGVLLIGAAADPRRETTHPLQMLVAADVFAGLLPNRLANANAELMALKPELERLGEIIGRIRAPVTMVQGLRDTLVPPENVAYLLNRLVGTVRKRVILVEKAGHFLPFTHAPLIEQALGRVVADAARMPQDCTPAPGLPSGQSAR